MVVFLDANIAIYAVEDPPVWGAKALAKLTTLRNSGDSFMASDLTRMECLVGPLKTGDKAAESDFRAFFASPGMRVVSITADVCDRAALVRAAYNFKPMDSLQLAAAVVHGADIFLTNDARLSSFKEITVEQLL